MAATSGYRATGLDTGAQCADDPAAEPDTVGPLPEIQLKTL